MFTLNCKGQLLSLEQPVVMGILNATPDSFFTGHLHKGLDGIVQQAVKMIDEGAAIIDVGGQSTRPGSQRISAAEEMERVLPVIEVLQKNHPQTIVSIDTYDSEVAAAAVQAGAHIVNDISGGTMDANMITTVASFKNVPYVCMHMKGRPENMQEHAQYDDVAKEVLDFFVQKQEACRAAGIKDMIVDPGFGFAKTAAQNFQLLYRMEVLQILERPILVGLSRKATIYKTLGTTAADALNGTTVMNTIGLLKGANILRVHDVKEAKEAVQLVSAYNKAVG